MEWRAVSGAMAPANALALFGAMARRLAFRAAALQGALLALCALVLVIAIGLMDESFSSTPRGVLLGVGMLFLLTGSAIPTLLLVRRGRGALVIAAGLYGAGAAAALLLGHEGAIVAGVMGAVGPLGVAMASAWRPLRGGEAWARRGFVCAGLGVAAPAIVIALAVRHRYGLLYGLAEMGKAIGFRGTHPPVPPCGMPGCGPQGTTIDPVWMSSMMAPLGAALLVSAFCAIAALVAASERWEDPSVAPV